MRLGAPFAALVAAVSFIAIPALAQQPSASEAAAAPDVVRPAPPPQNVTAKIPVHLEADSSPARFYVRTEDAVAVDWGLSVDSGSVAGYEQVCIAPCVAKIAAGPRRLAVSDGHGSPIEPAEPVVIPGPSTVTASYTSHRGLRVAGWVVMGVGVAVGTILMVGGATAGTYCPKLLIGPASMGSPDDTCSGGGDKGLLATGGIVLGLGLIGGLVMVLQHDHAELTVTPINAGTLVAPRRAEGASLTAPVADAPGIGATLRW